ncbi:MAG: hypothetical protein N2690_10735, partial [Rhodocyclaceae bacterium]|nr:hypothetical protein [Rhodocyclaceae bacterium]
IEALAPLVAPWGELSASSAQHWELRLTRSLLLETRPLAEAIGLPIDPALPGGLDGASWRRLLAEIQTTLHAHPVNRRREALGRPVINSLWPWGLGSLPEQAKTVFTLAWSANPVTAGLCALAGIPNSPAPARFQCTAGNVLGEFDALAQPAYALNALLWREALLELEHAWLAPALQAMRRGACQALRIVCPGRLGETRTVTYSLVRGNLWRFWRRPLPLSALGELA